MFRSEPRDTVDNMLKANSGSSVHQGTGGLGVTDDSDLTLFVRCSRNNIIDICVDSVKHASILCAVNFQPLYSECVGSKTPSYFALTST